MFVMNTQTQEALKMAIEALDNACMKIEKWTKGGKWTAGKEALAKCKEALAQPEQEPVAWIKDWADGSKELVFPNYDNSYPVYTHPEPSWQGLSDDEILEIDKSIDPEISIGKGKTLFARAIEQALKEKNNAAS